MNGGEDSDSEHLKELKKKVNAGVDHSILYYSVLVRSFGDIFSPF